MITRIILTAAALAAYSMTRTVFNPLSTLIQGEAAGQQLLNSDAAAHSTSS